MIANPNIKLLPLVVAGKLLKKKLGFRYLMDIIPLDATLIQGSHGRIPESTGDWPVFISKNNAVDSAHEIQVTSVYSLIMQHLNA